jgi:hypothetical protein
MDGDGIGRHLLRRAVIPFADDFDGLPLLAGRSERFLDAVVAVGIDRGAGDTAHFEDLAAAGHVA